MTAILIVGETYGEHEERERASFVGPAGRFLRYHLRLAGIDERHCAFTNVFNLRPKGGNDVLYLCGPRNEGLKGFPALGPAKYIRAEYASEIERLYREIAAHNPNLIIALGNTPTAVLTRQASRISSGRGTIILTRHTARPCGKPYKILPTYHPSAIIREYALRPIFFKDLEKAARASRSPDYVRPSRKLWLEPTLADLTRFWLAHIRPALTEPWGIDIETRAGTITEISFCRRDIGIIVPFWRRAAPDGNYWPTAQDELNAWSLVEQWLHFIKRPVFQNGLYDINYLWAKMGIQVTHGGEDTMLLHHAMQPEMKKSLGFLGSIYTEEPLWKTMRKDNETLKKED